MSTTEGIPRETMAAAEAGHPRAQFNVGWYYKNGKGVNKNLGEAARWWTKAAEQGYPAAQYSLGFDCYDQVGQDGAQKWIKLAADNGHQQAQGYLGFMYYWGGLGLPRDKITAHKWLILGTQNNQKIPPRIFCKLMKVFMTSTEIIEAERLAREWKPPPNVMSQTNPP